MKIAYIGQKGIPAKAGGVERHVEEVATRMAKNGHEVFVYVRNNYTDKKLHEYKGIKLIHLPSIPTKNLDAISNTFFATIHALFQNYDVIHYHSIGPTSLSVIPKILKIKAVIISTFHCQDYLHKKWGAFARTYLYFSEKLTCTIPDETITISQILSDYAKDKYGTSPIAIPSGAEIRFNPSDDTLNFWNLQKNEYILLASRLIRHKGVHYLINAFNHLCEKNLNQGKKLVIAGDGSFTDDYISDLKDLAKDNKNIIFTGTVGGEKLEQLFSHCYLFVQPSEAEGMSLALLEAMGYGNAILISDIIENTDVLKGTGFIFQNKNEKDLEDKLLYILNNPELAKKAGKNSRALAQDIYDWDEIVLRTEAVYKTVQDKKGKK